MPFLLPLGELKTPISTIKEEAGNCHLYERCGFVRIGEEYVVNEYMTLVDYVKTCAK